MKHTSPPWTVGVSVDYSVLNEPWPVFRLSHLSNSDPEGTEVQANRTLIEASPILLDSCLEMMGVLTSGKCAGLQMPIEFWVAYNKMEKAITKAQGGT